MEALAKGLDLAMQRIAAAQAKLLVLQPTLPVVSTMTISCRCTAPGTGIDTGAVLGFLAADSSSPFVLNSKGRCFRNSLMLVLPKPVARQRYGVKLFGNGSLSLTGLQAFGHLGPILEQVARLLQQAGAVQHPPEAPSFDMQPTVCLQLLNCNFKLGRRLNLAAVNEFLSSRSLPVFSRGMGSNNYPALVLKLFPAAGAAASHQASVHLFSTGSVLISGIKQPRHLADAFEVVVGALESLLLLLSPAP